MELDSKARFVLSCLMSSICIVSWSRKNQVPITKSGCCCGGPTSNGKEAIITEGKCITFWLALHSQIIQFAGKIAKLLSSPYLLVHYDKVLDVENYRPIRIIEFEWYARYLNIENNNKSLYILYESVT